MPQAFSLPVDMSMDRVKEIFSNPTADSNQWNMYLAYAAATLYGMRQLSGFIGTGKKNKSKAAVKQSAATSPVDRPNGTGYVTPTSSISGPACPSAHASSSQQQQQFIINNRRPSVSLARAVTLTTLRKSASMQNIMESSGGPTSPTQQSRNANTFPGSGSLSSQLAMIPIAAETAVEEGAEGGLAASGIGNTIEFENKAGGSSSGIECASVEKKDGTYEGFWSDIAFLLKIGFKGKLLGKELFLLVLYISLLLVRTIISTRIVFMDGEMLQAVIAKDKKALLRTLTIWLLIGIPTAIINSLNKYLNQTFALALRTNINDYLMKKYFASQAFYKIAPVGGRKHCIANVDQAITDDVALWSTRLSNLISFLGKPAFDMCFFSSMLFNNFGFWNQFAGMAASYEVGKLLHYVRPNFSEKIRVKGSLEADLRAAHAKIIAGAEEIAFSSGEHRERGVVQALYDKFRSYASNIYLENFRYFCCEEYVTRYVWSTIGMLQVAYVAFSAQLPAAETAKRVVVLRRIMAKNGSATEKYMRGVKLIHEFAGVTSGLMAVVNSLKTIEVAAAAAAERTELRTVANCDPTDIAVEDLVIATPANEILIKSLTFRLKQHDRLLVLGPNGCGKSSLFRVLCGLWPQRGGKIHVPPNRDAVFFLPQKPYVMRGTLREQFHYPDLALKPGVTDEDLMDIIDTVKLKYLVDNAGGLDTIEDWGEILSGGEKQRIGLARIFYQKPLYAVLDECSSAINVEAEMAIFGRLCDLGTTLITISHRQSLQKFHTKLLIFDGVGGYKFVENFKEDELSALKQRRDSLALELKEVLKGLGEDWVADPSKGEVEVGDMDDDDIEEFHN